MRAASGKPCRWMGDLAGSRPRAGTVQTLLAAAEELAGMARRREGCRCRQNLTDPRIWNLTASWGNKGAVIVSQEGPPGTHSQSSLTRPWANENPDLQ